jgi:hypothetical protein
MKRSRRCRFLASLLLVLATTQILAAQYITGPRGGCYTIGRTGRKNYVDRSFCAAPPSVESAQPRAFLSSANSSLASPQTASPPTASKERPKISIASEPSGADIEIDGEFVGSTPSTLTAKEGPISISIKKKGYVAWERKVRLSEGDKRTFAATLEKN